jgi:DNA replication licensing factor MCM4
MLARHLVSLFWDDPNIINDHKIEVSTLRDYIAYAKALTNPSISDDASHVLVRKILDWRSQDKNGTIGATPRQLESLIRISEALAKMKLCTEVSLEDAKEAFRL